MNSIRWRPVCRVVFQKPGLLSEIKLRNLREVMAAKELLFSDVSS